MRPKAVDEDKEKKGLAGKDGSNDGEAVGGEEGARGVGERTEKRTSCRKTALPPPPPRLRENASAVSAAGVSQRWFRERRRVDNVGRTDRDDYTMMVGPQHALLPPLLLSPPMHSSRPDNGATGGGGVERVSHPRQGVGRRWKNEQRFQRGKNPLKIKR